MEKTIETSRAIVLRSRGGLLTQFVAVAGTVLVTGMLATGLWVTSEIEVGVTDSAGAVTALYVDAIIAPVTQELDNGGSLGDEARRELDHIVRRGALRDEVSAFKLWDPDGRIVFSDNPGLVGRVFDASAGLTQALAGNVDAALARQSHIDGAVQNDQGSPLLEVYSPVRSATTGRIIAVAEFYTTVERLREHLFDARLKSWLVVGLISLGMFSALYVLFARGNRTISLQRRALDEQIHQLSSLLDQNKGLTQRVEQANHRIADLNERNLRRISAELHDGPVQLLAFAALCLDSLKGSRREQVRQAVNEAMKEIRDICSGLALPQVEGWSVATIAKKIVSAHEGRTGHKVVLDLQDDLPELSQAAKICIYRFLQETLNNGSKHAHGARQTVAIARFADGIEVQVRDDGPGFAPPEGGEGLGLLGLRERVAGLKGSFDLQTNQGRGTHVVMRLPEHKEIAT